MNFASYIGLSPEEIVHDEMAIANNFLLLNTDKTIISRPGCWSL